MKKAMVKKLVKICVAYDPFTKFIENCNQQEVAEANNKELEKQFEAIMAEAGMEVKGIPFQFRNVSEDELVGKVEKWLEENGIQIEVKVWTEDEIGTLIQVNDKVLYGALKKLYNEQTADEKCAGETKHNNGVGFNGADSKFMSSVAEFLIKRGFLTDKQKYCVRKKLVKYTKQLTKLANGTI